MKKMRKFRFVVFVAALAVLVSLGLSNAFGQSACIDNCLEAYDRCINSPGTNNCDLEYDACVEDCLGQ